MNELLAIIGGSWQPLLLYPGVLTGLLLTLVLRSAWRVGWPGVPELNLETLIGGTCALLLLALLPLPRSYWAYPLDLIGALALLELPYWQRLAARVRTSETATAEVAALLNVYALLALAVAALGQASGSLLLTEVKSGQPLLRWAGLVTWAIALPPLLALGPWREEATDDWLTDLRRVGHIGLLLALALPAGDTWGHNATAIGAATIFGALTLLHFLWHGRPEFWERFQPLIALALLGLLLYTSAGTWAARLR